jgi:fructan beta-fructosidase
MFSGSAVVDWNNTSGFGKDGKPPLVLIYTAAGNPTVQGIAYSTDGRTFTKYSGNPVLRQVTAGNRDPKVIWHQPTRKWVMVLYVERQGKHTVHFFTSPNLKDWTLASVTEGDPTGMRYLFECPDFFELPVDGDRKQTKWVLLAANGAYATGAFDGERFTPDQHNLPGPRGLGFYAPQTFSDIPPKDGRRILIGWFQTETRGMPFNQSMTLPLELRLVGTPAGPRLTYTPVRELQALRTRTHRVDGLLLQPGDANPLAGVDAELLELHAEFEPREATEVAFDIRGVPVIYHATRQEVSVNGHSAPAPMRDGKARIVLFCDRTGLEVFAADGLTYLPLPVNLPSGNRTVAVASRGGAARISRLRVYPQRSAWRPE